ncbi:MAG TPA: hypothetical protein VJS44_05800 [Pyrinomonadaceae bacterium]|nr:hypothetical protein [Pyrinomonadaceae bacterium]
MKKRTRRWLGVAALALGAAGAVVVRRGKSTGSNKKVAESVWARPGMRVTFRAELMPGRDASERTFMVAELLPSGRVTLEGKAGEHAETEFERVR